jgi:starch phosphorylase
LIFSGKAHPRDDAGKELIRQIADLARRPELGRHLLFLEDYDLAVGRYLVQGADVWLNSRSGPT